jgi:tetratricopeptide (TPR) repeat protein
MKIDISKRYQVLFIIFVSLGVYYPSIFGQANSVDDVRIITNLFNIRHFDLINLFFPKSPLGYYRPVLLLSFLLDRFVFFCSESFMHLENIVLHTINGVLVFFIATELIRRFKIVANRYVPMFTSLLFILHPINTEPVNWISARTDLLAGTFVFLAFLLFLKKGMGTFRWCWPAAFLYLLGLLSKEVAFGLLPVVGLLLILKEDSIHKLSPLKRLLSFLPFVFVTLVYLVMRDLASGYSHGGFETAAGVAESGHLSIIWGSAVKAFGFYIKKLFIPVPLNFAIIRIHGTFYFFFGIIMATVSCFLLWRRKSLTSFLFLYAVFFFLPAIPVAMRIIEAWTPLGERYLYISSFAASFLVVLASEKIAWRKEMLSGMMALLLGVAAFITVNRNIVWQNNLSLFEDTVKKSPDSAAARNEYAIALFNIGQTDKALEQFNISASLAGKIKFAKLPSLNAIEMKISRKDDPEEIREDYIKLLETTPQSSDAILRSFTRFLNSRAIKEENPVRLRALNRESLYYMEKLFRLKKTGFYAYRIGQLHLALGERQKAVEYFKKAVALSPKEYFSDPARKLIERLDAKN